MNPHINTHTHHFLLPSIKPEIAALFSCSLFCFLLMGMCFAEMKDKVGFRFLPTDEELINHFLKPKLQGGLVVKYIAVVEDFLKHEPQNLPALSAIKSKDQFWYFIYPLDKYNKSSKRASRKTKTGYWKATGVVRKVWAKKGTKGKEEIGIKRTLVFYEGSFSNKSRTNWVIHEYHATAGFDNPAYVICRLENKPDGKANTSTPDKVESSHQSSSGFGNHVAENTVLEDSLSMADLDQNIGCDETIGRKNLVVESDSLDLGAVGISSAQLLESLCGISHSGMNFYTNNEVPISQGDSLSLGDLQPNIGCDEQDYNFYLELSPLFTVLEDSLSMADLEQNIGCDETIGRKNLVVESDSLDLGAVGISSAQLPESLCGISHSGMNFYTNNEVPISQGDSLSLGDLQPNIGCDEQDYNFYLELSPLFTVLEDSLSMADLEQNIGCDETIGRKNLVVESDSLDLGAVGISSAQLPESLCGISYSGMNCYTNNEVPMSQGDSLSLGDLLPNIGCYEQDYNFYLELPPQFNTIESYGLDWAAVGISSAQPLESLSGMC